MFGYNNGVIGGCIVLPSFHRDFNLPPVGTKEYTTIISNIVSFLQIGALAGSLLVFSIVKFLGRRCALGCGGGVFFIGCSMQVFAHGSLSLMYSGRAICGIGLGCVTVLVPMVISKRVSTW
jgi:MFS family permease